MSTEITYVGEESYHSSDFGDDNRSLDLNAGDSATVSDEKAAQLAADLPHLFEIDGKPAGPARSGGGEPDPDSAEELHKLKRNELDEKAAGLGVEEPEQLPNKGAVVDAILAKLAEDQAQ